MVVGYEITHLEFLSLSYLKSPPAHQEDGHDDIICSIKNDCFQDKHL